MSPEQLAQSIADGCAELGQRPNAEQQQKYARLLLELERWAAKVNLTAIRNLDEMVSGHLLDSLAVRPQLRGSEIIDIGTGAGFPGLPLAIAEPSKRFVLLDSNGKKIAFVQHMVTLLGLENVTATRSRAEDYAPGRTFDTVIARALATIPKIIDVGGHLVGEKGIVLALKGKYPAAELEQTQALPGQWQSTVDEIVVPGLEQHARHVVRLERKD